MMQVSLWAGWIGILLGMASGAVLGLGFHDEHWLGGYASWPRRLLRLGHISFFGIAFLNLGLAGTLALTGRDGALATTSMLMAAGAVLMPTVCFLAAWRKPLRHLFALPVLCLIGAAGTLLGGLAA